MAETSETRRLSEIREAFLSAGAPAEYSLGFERNSGGKKRDIHDGSSGKKN